METKPGSFWGQIPEMRNRTVLEDWLGLSELLCPSSNAKVISTSNLKNDLNPRNSGSETMFEPCSNYSLWTVSFSDGTQRRHPPTFSQTSFRIWLWRGGIPTTWTVISSLPSNDHFTTPKGAGRFALRKNGERRIVRFICV